MGREHALSGFSDQFTWCDEEARKIKNRSSFLLSLANGRGYLHDISSQKQKRPARWVILCYSEKLGQSGFAAFCSLEFLTARLQVVCKQSV